LCIGSDVGLAEGGAGVFIRARALSLEFTAVDDPRRVRWFPRFLERVLRNEPDMMALLEKNPFPETPPVFVRALYYDYTYASPEEKAKGQWWDRRLLGVYFPASRLK